MRRDLLAARGRVHKLSFFVQNFMDASALDPERIHACSFKKAPSLIAFVNRYREKMIPEGWKVEFIPYDWQLNTQ